MFGLTERIEVVKLMIKLESVTLVRRELVRRKWKQVPSEKTCRSLLTKFETTGSVADLPRSGRPHDAVNDSNVEAARSIIDENFHSCTEVANVLNISRGSAHTILRYELGLKPYKLQLHQRLSEEDMVARVVACQAILLKNDEESILDHLITSDEATFYLNGVVNRHNCRIWADEKPPLVLKKEHSSPKVNVWIGFDCDFVYGPYFFPESTVKAKDYLTMLRDFFFPLLLRRRGQTTNSWFQQDGAPPHWAVTVRNELTAHFGTRWIGRGGPLTWPARSPDLAPPDFFYWGFVKNKVYKRQPQSLEEMKTFIQEESASITPEILRNVRNAFQRRLQKCIQLDGCSVE